MAYDKHIWTCGEAITTEKLNHMEDGIAEGGEVSLEDLEALLPTETASGEIVTITDGQSVVPAKSLKVALEPIQAGSGTPSPDNVRPISGHTEVVTWDDPKYGGTVVWNQLCNNQAAPSSRNGVTIQVDTDSFTMDGTSTGFGASGWFDLDSPDIVPHQGHKALVEVQLISGTISDNTALNFNIGGSIIVRAGSSKIGIIPNGEKVRSSLYITNGTVLTNAKIRIQLFDLTQMFGSTIADYIYSLEQANDGAGVAFFRKLFPNDYYEYNSGETTCVSAINGDEYRKYTTDLGRTVYGGTLDVVSGVLTVDRGYIASYNGETLPSTWISDRDEYVAGTTPSIGAEVVYTLATPQTYQLTPQQIELFLGTNNVWSNGEVTMIYNADVQLWVEKKLS